MYNKNIDSNSVVKIHLYGKTKQLGRTLSHEGVTDILHALKERPKKYKELTLETDLPNSTLERVIKELLGLHIIKKNPITSENRDTHQYDLTPNGLQLMKFIKSYEKEITLPLEQQRIIDVEKNNIESY
jgi:DNA-binding HxlR family transcriptional regulator